jgi:hypothetical protein
MIQFACPFCKSVDSVSDDKASSMTTCARCLKPLIVPVLVPHDQQSGFVLRVRLAQAYVMPLPAPHELLEDEPVQDDAPDPSTGSDEDPSDEEEFSGSAPDLDWDAGASRHKATHIVLGVTFLSALFVMVAVILYFRASSKRTAEAIARLEADEIARLKAEEIARRKGEEIAILNAEVIARLKAEAAVKKNPSITLSKEDKADIATFPAIIEDVRKENGEPLEQLLAAAQ